MISESGQVGCPIGGETGSRLLLPADPASQGGRGGSGRGFGCDRWDPETPGRPQRPAALRWDRNFTGCALSSWGWTEAAEDAGPRAATGSGPGRRGASLSRAVPRGLRGFLGCGSNE